MNSLRRNNSAWISHLLQHPLARFGAVLIAIFLAEMAAHSLQFGLPGWAGALVDAAALTTLAAIFIWPLIIKPLQIAVQAEQARAQGILDSASDAIITIDEYGIIQAQNRAARAMFGASDQDAIGRNVSMFVPSPHRERHDRYLENYRRTGEKRIIGTTRQLEAVRLDGAVFPIELTVSEVWVGGRRFFTAIVRDVTRRVHAEARLQKLSHAVEQSPAATVITDTDGRIEYANPRFSEITGYAAEEAVGKTTALIKSGLTPRHVYEDLWRTIKSGGVWRGEMQNRKKTGELYWEYEIISPIENERGEIINFIAVKEDISARKRAEEALEQQHLRLLETERDLRHAQESLADAARLESVGRLAAGVAHEVKNPLTIMRLGIDYLAIQPSTEINREILDDLRGAVDRADYVIKDLLDFTRQNPFVRRPTDINQVTDKAIRLVMHEMDQRNIELVSRHDDPTPPISADPERLVQVFINLLSNAAQAIGRNGSIEVLTRSIRLGEPELERSAMGGFRIGEPVITVDIRDNGPGISAENEKKLFEPFFTTKPVGEGTGLGLAVSHNIVIMHEGSIDIRNRPEGGASALLVFRVDSERHG